jgi:hypothetical protein
MLAGLLMKGKREILETVMSELVKPPTMAGV